uniref:Putative cytochrome P450 6a14 n=1 Tax=Lygus hesperus TaxID=30085 RepID=A0A0A9YG98_LYGHE
MTFIELAILAAAAFGTYCFYKFIKLANFFKDKGIPYIKPIWPLGSDVRGLLMRDHPTESLTKIYYNLEPHKIGGYYVTVNPTIMVRDPEWVQKIYTTDFSHFVDRGIPTDPKNNPLEGHLFLLEGAKWRYMRAKLSPIFTSGKLKWMYGEMRKCVDAFITHLEKTVPFGEDIDMKEDASGFTIEVISSCAFGIESNSIGNPNSEFRVFSKKIFTPSKMLVFKTVLRMLSPALFTLLKMKSLQPGIEEFVMNIVKQSFDHRLTTGYTRNDFIQLLLQLREQGTVEVEEHEKDEEDHQETLLNNQLSHSIGKEVVELDDGLLGAQLFVFLIAGFETTSTTIYHLTYLLSQNEECQDKAREEINRILAKHGDFSYDMLRELTYLSNCIDETLRLFPPVPFMMRTCTKEYTFPDGTTIPKKTNIVIPVYSIQHDPKYFPEPEKFKPERFEHGIIKGSYSPFGEGPRVCIGKRFALVEIKLAMARLLTTFRFSPATAKKDEISFLPHSFLLSVKGGLPMKIAKLVQ